VLYAVFVLLFLFLIEVLLSLFYFNMDKFLNKRRKIEDESVTECNSIKNENEQFPSVSAVKAVQRDVQSLGTVRKYQDSYLNFGLAYSGPENLPVLECVVCREQLSNEYTAPSKLKRHLNSKYSLLSRKDRTILANCCHRN
jgi:hypothetical protein